MSLRQRGRGVSWFCCHFLYLEIGFISSPKYASYSASPFPCQQNCASSVLNKPVVFCCWKCGFACMLYGLNRLRLIAAIPFAIGPCCQTAPCINSWRPSNVDLCGHTDLRSMFTKMVTFQFSIFWFTNSHVMFSNWTLECHGFNFCNRHVGYTPKVRDFCVWGRFLFKLKDVPATTWEAHKLEKARRPQGMS